MTPSNTNTAPQNNLNWDSYAKHYRNLGHLESYQDLLDSFLTTITTHSKHVPKKILDIGCGVGSLTKRLATRFPDAQITGIDNNAVMIKKANELAAGNLKFELFDILQLSEYPEKNFELIVMNNVLYILDNKKQVLSSIKQLLSPNGILIFSDPKPPEDYNYLSIISRQFRSLQSFFKFLTLLPSFIYIYYFNKKIDKSYNRLSKQAYLELINECGYSVLDSKEAYAGQANMFILK